MPLLVRRAEPHEVAIVSQILEEAARWIASRQQPLWDPSDIAPEAIRADVKAGYYFLAMSSGQAVGSVRFAFDDALVWPDVGSSEAAYVHRLAVRRSHAGGEVSRGILTWAVARARELGCRYLRLDCDASRVRLRLLYEEFGFRFHSECTVGRFVVARYEIAF